MNNILITGCAGFIGFHLSELLLKLGNRVIGIDNVNNYYSADLKLARLNRLNQYQNFLFYKKNIQDLNNIELDYQIDCLINLAAQAGVRLERRDYDKYLFSNIDGFLSVLDFCVENNIDKIMYASSSSVYGDSNSIPFSENEAINSPKSVYASSKIFNENLASVYASEFNLNLIGFRFFTVYGPWGRPDMAYYKFAESILDNKPIYLNNKGLMSRDMTFISDIVQGISTALNTFFLAKNKMESLPENKIFNLGNDSPIETIYLLNSLQKILGKKAKIIHTKTSNEVLSTHADLTRSLKYIQYKPKVSFEDGLQDFLTWLKKYRELN